MTDCCDDATWLQQRIADKKALLVQLETAVANVVLTGQNYSIDTGQTRQTVTRAGLTETRNFIAQLETEISTLQQRLNGCGRFYVRPGW